MTDLVAEPSTDPRIVVDPYSGLQLIELGHVWGHGVPSMPGQLDVRMQRAVKHAQHGVLAWRVTTSLHTGTHMNAPIHLVQKGADLAAVSVDRLFGNGAVVDVPKGRWELVTAADLQAAKPEIKKGDIVVVDTGWHHKYSDGLEYWGSRRASPRTPPSGSSRWRSSWSPSTRRRSTIRWRPRWACTAAARR